MQNTIKLELHCHSLFSDGVYAPEKLVSLLYDAKVAYASLTDHDSLEGQHAFHKALSTHSLGYISGIELTTWLDHQELHILGYGFDTENETLNSLLSIKNSTMNETLHRSNVTTPIKAIELIHAAGGIAVLAHPLISIPDKNNLTNIIEILHTYGLDGIEDCKGVEPHDKLIAQLAKKYSLVTSVGTDYHGNGLFGSSSVGVDVDIKVWKKFRDALRQASWQHSSPGIIPDDSPAPSASESHPAHWRSFALHIISPTILALALFVTMLFFVLLPAFERALMERKREMIRELTNTAISVLREAYTSEMEGKNTKETAQYQAALHIKSLHYGRESKDYFWIQDLSPKMIMHPYRPDLDNADLSSFVDARGNHIFVEFAEIVKKKGEGYVQYVWQWKDDPERLEPKESYLRLFKPWNWVIGTGIYIHDVQIEINRYRNHLALLSTGIACAVALLLLYSMRNSMKLEKKRKRAEQSLFESTNRYRTLVNAATEGALFVHGIHCRYANPVMLAFVGCDEKTIELMEIEDVFPSVNDNSKIHSHLLSPDYQPQSSPEIECLIRRSDEKLVNCSVVIKKISGDSSTHRMLLVRHLDKPQQEQHSVSQNRLVLERLLKLPAAASENIVDMIKRASDEQAVVNQCKKTPALVRSLLDNAASPPAIAKMLSLVSDTATTQLINLAIQETGDPPVPFCFCALGSQGRQEQTLFTDQDNAIIYEDNNDPDVAEYFKILSTRVCDGLSKSGYRECSGKVMASNPKWCQSLQQWKNYFEDWIQKALPQELMEFSVFFDFRSVVGNTLLASELKSHIFEVLKISPWFYPYFAQNALNFKAPLRLFGAIVTASISKEQHGKLDLKAAMIPIVSFAQLYSLYNFIPHTNTLERLDLLTSKGILLESKRNDITSAYESLLRLRLRHQIETIETGKQANNFIAPGWLGHIEEAILKECFNEIDSIQNRIKLDFLGGG